jgi:hypothetical protein
MIIVRNEESRGSGDLLDYMSDEQLRSRSDRPMTAGEVQRFIDLSEKKEYTEQWIFSPKEGGELSDEEMSLAVRKTMREHLNGRKRGTYCFSIHRDTEHDHAHIAMTGQKSDLKRVSGEEYAELREIGARATREVERDRRNGREIEEERRDDDRARDAETAEAERARGTRAQPDRDRDSDRERGW